MTKLSRPALALFCALSAGVTTANDNLFASGKGEFSVSLWGPTVSGDATISSSGRVFELDFDDLIDGTDGGLLLRFQNRGERFGGGIDLAFGSMSDDTSAASTDLDTVAIDLFGLMALNEQIDMLFGVRSFGIDASITVPGVGSADDDGGTIDGFIGARLDMPLSDRWSVDLQLDAGAGEADFIYHGLVGANWRFSDTASLRLAYKILGYEFSDDDVPVDNEFDLQIHGPSVGVKVDF